MTLPARRWRGRIVRIDHGGVTGGDEVSPTGGCDLPSHAASLNDLVVPCDLPCEDRPKLRLGVGWTKRWTVTYLTSAAEVTRAVADLSDGWLPAQLPVRRFSWATGQRHRPGLQYMACTGRHHGFESLAEQRLLLALDFLKVDDVVAQPFELRFVGADGWRRHVPDFLAVDRDGVSVIDVRPAELIRAEDRIRFAATAEVAAVLGWRFLLVAGWRPGIMSNLDALSAQRRALVDHLDLQPQLISLAGHGPVSFAQLVSATAAPAVARAHALHLIWHHRLGVDLAAPLGDESAVWAITA